MNSNLKLAVLSVVSVLLAACASAPSPELPGAAPVQIVYPATDTSRCTVLGPVNAIPPYMWLNADLKQLQAQTAGMRGDTVLVTYRKATTSGVALRCGV